jgi:Kef-type K+ transport system membrane component KefB
LPFVWVAMALVASVLSVRLVISVALVEILVGAIVGNLPHASHYVQQTEFTTFLASLGSVMLTFLAGAEIDPVSLRRHWMASLSIGFVSFLLPFLGAFAFCSLVLGWDLHASEIGGIALSTTSVAVVYAVMVETELNRESSASSSWPPVSSRTSARCWPWVASLRTSGWCCSSSSR